MPLRPLPTSRLHYAWVVVAVTFLVLLAAAGARSAPGVLLVPLETSFGWTRAQTSLAVSINLVLYGLVGPFAAALMHAIGIRRTALAALALLATGSLLSLLMRSVWQLQLSWGVLVGVGSGMAALTLGATVVNRWFFARRGLAMGLMTASSATGQLVFLPLLALLAQRYGWQAPALVVGLGCLAILPVAAWLLRDTPEQVGLLPFGVPERVRDSLPPEVAKAASRNPLRLAFSALAEACKSKMFWLLFGSFFVCGASTNGLIGTHFISMCIDHGLSGVQGASLLAMMGIFDMVGTTASGWLSDRVDSRKLLFWYYGLRGLSLLYLPYAFGFDFFGLPVFTLFYGLDWIATVPPTVRLANDAFGRERGAIVFGWIAAGHQLGAAASAGIAGLVRASLGNYQLMTMAVGGICCATALMVLAFGRAGRKALRQA